MSFEATGRFALLPAPGGLTLVQDLLNTIPAVRFHMPDFLSTTQLAAAWLATAASNWSSAIGAPMPALREVGENDLPALRRLRDAVGVAARTGTGGDEDAVPAPVSGSLSLTLDGTGRVSTAPRGTTAAGWLRSAVLAEMLEAQRADTWRRLKVCRNDGCAVAFYDRSKNNSGVWHDARICGNAINLRASRDRRSGRDVTQAGPGVAPDTSATTP
jgi:predicted RNA-binding Zn ribbon-like protein